MFDAIYNANRRQIKVKGETFTLSKKDYEAVIHIKKQVPLKSEVSIINNSLILRWMWSEYSGWNEVQFKSLDGGD